MRGGRWQFCFLIIFLEVAGFPHQERDGLFMGIPGPSRWLRGIPRRSGVL